MENLFYQSITHLKSGLYRVLLTISTSTYSHQFPSVELIFKNVLFSSLGVAVRLNLSSYALLVQKVVTWDLGLGNAEQLLLCGQIPGMSLNNLLGSSWNQTEVTVSFLFIPEKHLTSHFWINRRRLNSTLTLYFSLIVVVNWNRSIWKIDIYTLLSVRFWLGAKFIFSSDICLRFSLQKLRSHGQSLLVVRVRQVVR